MCLEKRKENHMAVFSHLGILTMPDFHGTISMSFSHQVKGKYHLVWVDLNRAFLPLYVTSRLEATRELRNMGWQVTLVLEGPSGWQSIRGVEVFCISRPKIFILGNILFHLRFLHIINREWSGIDLILIHPTSAPWLLPLRILRQLRGDSRPLLLMDTRDRNAPGNGLKNQLRAYYGGFVNHFASQWADGQTAITKRMADFVHIPQNQLWGIWPSGVNLEHFSPAQTSRKWPIGGQPIHLIYIGSLLHARNLLVMCQAVEKENCNDIRFKFSLYGEGSARADLEAFSQQTAGRVNVFSPVSHDQIPEVLAQAHVGVTSLFSSEEDLFKASSPIKLFEYMATGMPVFATRIPCHTDVIGTCSCAFWVENPTVEGFTAALRNLWNERSSLADRGRLAAQLAQDYTWAASAKKLASALEYGMATTRRGRS
jgi:glycosyltransferase involved in cell wall biosynthesis